MQTGCVSLSKQDWILLSQSAWLIELCPSPSTFETKRKTIYIVTVRTKDSRILQVLFF